MSLFETGIPLHIEKIYKKQLTGINPVCSHLIYLFIGVSTILRKATFPWSP